MPAASIQDSVDFTASLERLASPVIGQIPPFARVAAITESVSFKVNIIVRLISETFSENDDF